MKQTTVSMSQRLAILAAVAAVCGLATVRGQTSDTKEQFTAFAVNLAAGAAGARAGTVEITVERWSSDDERDELRTALLEKGPDGLLSALQKTKRVGYIRTPDTIGYDLHYARQVPREDGGRRIVLATDRRIGFWEAVNRPRTIDYPFTVIELRVDQNGTGEGKMSIATKITMDPDTKVLELEDYSSQPVLLESVHKMK
jgi:hypothetical protein